MNRNKLLFGALVVVLMLAMILMPAKVLAGSISIEPLRQELELRAGQAITGKLRVRNNSSQPATVRITAESFSIVNESYDYAFAQSEDIKNWVHFDKSELALRPGESGNVAYSVGAPNNAEPGGKYIAIFASVENKPTLAASSINRVGLLLYITTPGSVSKKAKVLGIELPSVTTNRQAFWGLRIHSTGSAHFKSRVTTTVSNIFGQAVSTSANEHLILPDTIRNLEDKAKLGRWPGVYRVHFLVGQGDDPAYKQTKWVFYTPIVPTILLAIGLLVIIRLLLKTKRKRTYRRTR